MLILKFNTLSAQDLFAIERRLFRWLDAQGTCGISDDFNVLDYGRTDLYGHLLGIFAKLDIFKAIGTTPSQMLDFFIDVDTTYLNAPYHSFYHAVDIVTVLYYILTELAADHYLSDMDVASLMIAALCHDAGHPGYNNLYQVNFKTDLANRYGNTSTLEAYSVDITRNLLKKHGLLKNLGSATEERILATIENLILSTDMVYHYELQEQLGSLEDSLANDDASDWYDAYDADISDTDSLYFSSADDDSSISTSNATITTTTTSLSSSSSITGAEVCEDDTTLLLNQEQRRSFCRVLLHAADISNTVRPWSISKQWSDLIVQEFFQQGDAEKQAGLEISPGMDRDQSTQPNISLKFGDFVVKPYFEALAAVLPAAHSFLTKLAENRCEWERLKNCPEAASPPPPAHERQFPASLLPAQPVLNPAGRRVSVAAGMVVIPDQRISRRSKQRSTKIRRQLGSRSASHSGLPRISLPDNTINENVSFAHRRQSEHTYSLYGASYCISPTLLRPVIFDSSSSNSLTVYEQDKYVHPRRSQPRVA